MEVTMDELRKRDLLKHAKNEYLSAMLAAKVARRLHAMHPDDRPDPRQKVTSLALALIAEGEVEYDMSEPEELEDELLDDE